MKKTILALTAVITAVAAVGTFHVAPVQAQLNCDGPPYWCTTIWGCDNDPHDCRTVIYYKQTSDSPLPMPLP